MDHEEADSLANSEDEEVVDEGEGGEVETRAEIVAETENLIIGTATVIETSEAENGIATVIVTAIETGVKAGISGAHDVRPAPDLDLHHEVSARGTDHLVPVMLTDHAVTPETAPYQQLPPIPIRNLLSQLFLEEAALDVGVEGEDEEIGPPIEIGAEPPMMIATREATLRKGGGDVTEMTAIEESDTRKWNPDEIPAMIVNEAIVIYSAPSPITVVQYHKTLCRKSKMSRLPQSRHQPQHLGKPPPTAPRAFSERPGSSGHDAALNAPTGPAAIPSGPRSQQLKQRPSSKQWINPNLKKPPESPKLMRSQSQFQPRPYPQYNNQEDTAMVVKRPRSSDGQVDLTGAAADGRERIHRSEEPGEIVNYSERSDARVRQGDLTSTGGTTDSTTQGPKVVPKAGRKRKRMGVSVVRFDVPVKGAAAEQDSESDDDEDMADYFAMEIEKTEVELNKLEKPNLPLDASARFAKMSFASTAKLPKEREGLAELLGPLPEGVELPGAAAAAAEEADAETQKRRQGQGPGVSESVSKTEDMDIDREQPNSVSDSMGRDPIAARAKAGLLDADRTLLPSTETGSKPPSTPSQVADDGDETESDEDTYMDIDNVRQFLRTPPIDSLPDYGKAAWDEDDDFLATIESNTAIDDYVIQHLDKIDLDKTTEQAKEKRTFARAYLDYRHFTRSDDPIAVKSRDKFSAAAPAVEPADPGTPEPKPEGRGTGRRFATERDLERVIQASMREDEERRERELRLQRDRFRSEKEAVIPDMYWTSDEKLEADFIDNTGYTPQDRLVAAWHVLPPVNNFTVEEQELFEKRYLELPKQWGKVAEAVPNRDFGTCIQYYYMMKKELNLKEKLRKQPKRRKKSGRGKGRSSALMSELGNRETEGEETQEVGENGERRRPRRAAAPTWGFEQGNTDSDNATPAGTPGRRGVSAAKGDGEKVDGRTRRRKANKDKEAKAPKANQALAAAPPNGAGRGGRARSTQRTQPVEFQPMPTQFEQVPAGMQPPFAVQQPPLQSVERPGVQPPSSISDVMAAPSLRPEPPPMPPPVMNTFSLAQPQAERKATAQASSYWSVSESNDFPHLLKSFGSDWTAIAAHMGSKTAVMVKNYFVRQKDQGKTEWEAYVQEADAKRARGEKRPEPPQPTTGGRGRRYDNVPAPGSRPLAVAPGMDLHGDAPPVKADVNAPPRGEPFSSYNVPIAQAPAQQPLAQPAQTPMGMQPHGTSQPVTQAMSPNTRPLQPSRAPLQFLSPHDRERERLSMQPRGQGGPEPREQRPLPTTQPLHPAQPEGLSERQRMEIQMREQQQIDRERERERELARQAELHPLRMKPETSRFDPFGSRPGPGREPLALNRRSAQEVPSRGGAQGYTGSLQQPSPHRSLMAEPAQGRSPPPLTTSARGGMPPLHQSKPSGSGPDRFGSIPTPSNAGGPTTAPPRQAEPRKTSSIMSLLNADPPPAPKRVSDVSSAPPRPSPTPPPQGMGRPPPGATPSSQMRREGEMQYPYGRTPSGGASAMPSLKPPPYSASPQSQHMAGSRTPLGMHVEPPAAERDYYRQHAFPQQGSGPGSPQSAPHRYPPGSQAGQPHYQQASGFPAPYNASQPPHSASPPPQFGGHGPAPRGREVPQGGRDNSWPVGGHQQPAGWPGQPPKTSQPPGPTQSWASQPPSGTPKPTTPGPGWAGPPPQQPPHVGMREERGPPAYGSNQPPPQQMQGRYGTPASRGPDPGPPPGQPYRGYSSTPAPGPGPGPGPQRESGEMPGRSYTPGGYDGRGPPPPPGPGYPGVDPRDTRDPRDAMTRGLRPHEYDRHPERYGR